MTLIGGHIGYIPADWDKFIPTIVSAQDMLDWSNNIEYFNGDLNSLAVVGWSNNEKKSLTVKARTSTSSMNEVLSPNNTNIIVAYLNDKEYGVEILYDIKSKSVIQEVPTGKLLNQSLFYSYPPKDSNILLRDKDTGKLCTSYNSLGRVSAVFVERYTRNLLLSNDNSTLVGKDFLAGIICRMFELNKVDETYYKPNPQGTRKSSIYLEKQTYRLINLVTKTSVIIPEVDPLSLSGIIENGIPKVEVSTPIELDLPGFEEYNKCSVEPTEWLHFYLKNPNIKAKVEQQDIIDILGISNICVINDTTFDEFGGYLGD